MRRTESLECEEEKIEGQTVTLMIFRGKPRTSFFRHGSTPNGAIEINAPNTLKTQSPHYKQIVHTLLYQIGVMLVLFLSENLLLFFWLIK